MIGARTWVSVVLVLGFACGASAQAQEVAPVSHQAAASAPSRLHALSDELERLRRQRASIRLGLPVFALSVGSTAVAVAAYGSALANLCALGASCDGRDELQAKMLGVGVAGAAIGIGGLSWLLHNVAERRKLDPEIRAVRALIASEPGWNVYADPRHVSLHAHLHW